MVSIHTRVSRKQSAFTIVELLIVIVVIGILAAITIVAYNGVQNRANDITVQSDLNGMAKKMQFFYADHSRYPNSVAELATVGLDASNDAYAVKPNVIVNLGYCLKSDYSGYAFFAMSKSGSRYYVRESGGVRPDTTGTTWDGSTGTVSGQCSALGYTMNITHGYFKDDASGPWRGWAGGN